MNSIEFFGLVDRLIIFFAAIVYMYISPPLVNVNVVDEGSNVTLCSLVMIPVEAIVCFIYTYLVYLMVRSPDILIKSAGYGSAVAPLLVFAEINSY